MKKILLTTLTAAISVNSFAQLTKVDDLKKSHDFGSKDTVAWIHGGVFALGINEGFLHNWAAGGEVASMTINGRFNGFVNHINHNKVWTNNLDMTYGLFYAFSNHFVPRKVDDRIDFTSKYGIQVGKSKNLYLAGLFNFRSQFTKGYDYTIPNYDSFSTSKFLSPGYFTTSLGIEYRKENLSLFFSPAALRITVADKYYTMMTPQGAFGIEYGKTARYEFGAYFTGRYQVEVNKKLLFKTRVDLYSNYLAKNVKDSLGTVVKKDNPGNIDILWDNFLSYKLNKYMSFTLAATFIYDNDIPYSNTYTDPTTKQEVPKNEPGEELGWWQLKQVLAVGFEYRF